MDTDTRRFVIDTDWGLDDSLALMIGLSKLNIDAITCVSGNVEIDKVVINVSKVLQVCDAKVPIYKGASEPLIRDTNTWPEYHGDDGLGGNPDIMAMEGFKGNARPNAEYNFVTDPEAAFKVFKKFKNIHLIPWECCPEFEIPKEKYDLICDPTYPKTDFVGKSHHHQIKRKGYLYIWDGFTSLIAIDPTLCEYNVDLQARIFVDGEAAGQISYYWPGYTNKYDASKINCRVYRNFKMDETIDLLLECLRK